MQVHFLGVRGSTPAPGAAFVRYGGHTSCVALAHDGERPTLVIDAGTGLRRMEELLDGAPFRGTVLLTHLHWDHTHGLPFARSLDRDDAVVELWLPAQGGSDDGAEVAASALGRAMSPPSFPITPNELRGQWRFEGLEPGEHRFAGFTVAAAEVPHKGGRTFGYRVSDGQATIAYMSDHGPVALGPGPDGQGDRHSAALALAAGVDLLIHDAQHTAEEFPRSASFGHSTVDYAFDLGSRAAAGTVALFHHHPDRTDDEIDAIVASFADRPTPPAVLAAREDLVLRL